MPIATIFSIITTVVSDTPTLISLVEKFIPLIKENRAPTADEWTDIMSAIQTAHSNLQNSGTETKTSN